MTKTNLISKIAVVGVLCALPCSLLAQTTYAERHDINGRRANQQARIQQGKASGQLTRGETRNLEAHQHAIHQEEKGMRAADGGHLTAADRHTLARQQNRQSARIYDDKHNAATRPGVTPQ